MKKILNLAINIIFSLLISSLSTKAADWWKLEARVKPGPSNSSPVKASVVTWSPPNWEGSTNTLTDTWMTLLDYPNGVTYYFVHNLNFDFSYAPVASGLFGGDWNALEIRSSGYLANGGDPLSWNIVTNQNITLSSNYNIGSEIGFTVDVGFTDEPVFNPDKHALFYNFLGQPIPANKLINNMKDILNIFIYKGTRYENRLLGNYNHPGTTWQANFGTQLGTYSSGTRTATNDYVEGYAELTNILSSYSVSFCRLLCTNNGSTTTNYFTNVIGSALYEFPVGKTAFANPFTYYSLKISELMPSVPEGCGIMVQVGTGTTFTTNVFSAGVWADPNMELLVGKGFVFNNISIGVVTNLLDGLVARGNTTNNPAWPTSGSKYSFLANKIPKAGYLIDLGFNLGDEEEADGCIEVRFYNFNNGTYETTGWTQESGWSTMGSRSTDSVKGPWLNIGEPVMVKVSGDANPTWIQTFIP